MSIYCHPDRLAIATPWRLEDGRVVATNGHALAIWPPGDPGAPECGAPDVVRPDFTAILAQMDGAFEVGRLDGSMLPPVVPCGYCGDSKVIKSPACEACDGSGICICAACEHEHKCSECHGEGGGTQHCDCVPQTVLIARWPFNLRLLVLFWIGEGECTIAPCDGGRTLGILLSWQSGRQALVIGLLTCGDHVDVPLAPLDGGAP